VTLKNVNGEFQKIENAEEMKNPKELIILRKTLQAELLHPRGRGLPGGG